MLRKSLILGVALLAAFALVGSVQADGTPTPDHLHMESTPEADHDQGDRLEANGAAVKITSPQEGDVLDVSTVIVRVETTNWPLGEAGHHFHLYVNGKVQGMSQGNSPAIQARDLQPGDNTLEVVLSNEQHQELNATDKISVRFDVSASGPPSPAPLSSAPRLSIGVVFVLLGIAVVIVAILGIGFALTRKKSG
jgi:hypothetical protein